MCLYSCHGFTAWKSNLFCAELLCYFVASVVLPYYFTYLINGTIIGKECYWTYNKCFFFIFSAIFSLRYFKFKKNLETYYHKCTFVFILPNHYFSQFLMTFEHSWQTFENAAKIEFYGNSSTGWSTCSRRRSRWMKIRADRYDKHFLNFGDTLRYQV
jgi:hypothetical protein